MQRFPRPKGRLGVSAFMLLAATACGQSVDETVSDAANTSADAAEAEIETMSPTAPGDASEQLQQAFSVTLPPFPDLPAPKADLSDAATGLVYFNTRSPYDFSVVLNDYEKATPTVGMGTLVLPDGASAENPVPAMIILHGSGGIKEGREFKYAELFAENGVASFVVDYYAPRGATENTPYQLKTMATTDIDVLADAYAALKFVGTHPAIDAERIGVTGYSYGGMATRYALDARMKDIMAPETPPFALHIDVYGPCFQKLGATKTTGAPYLAIYGDEDNSVDPDACQIVQNEIKAGGSSVEAHLMPGAGHAWENDQARAETPLPYVRDCWFDYAPETGALLINGVDAGSPPLDATRDERAQFRASLAELAGPCVGVGYIVGSDPETDQKAKALMLDFMRDNF
ncbi:MAG: dienelactone hydrolase family protein [Pseudomonadota bacterium]